MVGGNGVEAVKRPYANPFKINTCTTVRKCCKQKTYAAAKSSGCNTYKKHEGGGVVMVNQKSRREPVAHPFRGEVSVCRRTCRSLLSAYGWCRRANLQSARSSRWASAPAPNRSWRRIGGRSGSGCHWRKYR